MAQTTLKNVHLETVEENKDKDTEPMQTRYCFVSGCAMGKHKTRLLADSRKRYFNTFHNKRKARKGRIL